MSAAKYWRDERTDDAVYAVYLRKVRYVPPNSYHGVTVSVIRARTRWRRIVAEAGSRTIRKEIQKIWSEKNR